MHCFSRLTRDFLIEGVVVAPGPSRLGHKRGPRVVTGLPGDPLSMADDKWMRREIIMFVTAGHILQVCSATVRSYYRCWTTDWPPLKSAWNRPTSPSPTTQQLPLVNGARERLLLIYNIMQLEWRDLDRVKQRHDSVKSCRPNGVCCVFLDVVESEDT